MPAMPRKATPKALEVYAAIEKIRLHCKHAKTNITALSVEVEVCQSALWRFMNGERKSITDAAHKTLEYIDNWHKCHNYDKNHDDTNDPEYGYNLIENAVKSLWNGNPKTAGLVASLIKALKPALDVAIASIQISSRMREDD